MNVKIVLLTVVIGALESIIVGLPSTVNEYKSTEWVVNRTKRAYPIKGDTTLQVGGDKVFSAISRGIEVVVKSIANLSSCSETAGCHKGYCWAWCGFSLSSGGWCYTTKTHSQSYQYVECNSDDDCDKCWKCAGPCAFF